MKQFFKVKGMSCTACVNNIEKTVNKLHGVKKCTVNLLANSMYVSYDENKLSDIDIQKAIKKIGYDIIIKNENKNNSDEYNIVNQLIISLIFFIPLFYISMGHMINLPIPKFLIGVENSISYSMTQFILLLPIIYINRIYFIRGFKALYYKNPNMDSLISIGTLAAIIYSVIAIYYIGYGLGINNITLVNHYKMELYFESAGTILTLITLGKYLEMRSKKKTTESISKLIELRPKTAIIEKNNSEFEVLIKDVSIGDIVIVKNGQQIPVDGTVIEGNGLIDQSALTGESIPVYKSVGDNVISGTFNQSGYFKFKATKVGENTTISQIISLVEEASISKAHISKLTDKISNIFVPFVMIVSFISVIIWLLKGESLEFALSTGISVLVISCPCALGLATPVAIMVATGKSAKEGILIKTAESLELAEKIQIIVLDKTGTITEGKPKVTDVITYNNFTKKQLLEIALMLEVKSEHPLSKAIIKYAKDLNISPKEISEFNTLIGYGISGKYNNTTYYAGNEKLMIEKGIFINESLIKIEEFSESGKTPLFFSDEKNLIGIIAVADNIKETSYNGINQLKNMGLETIMLTGDNKKTSTAIFNKIKCDKMFSNLLPQDKEKFIVDLQNKGKKVAMVGDGINDAPSLMRADIGIAISAGTDIAIESADIILIKNNLEDISKIILLSKKVMKIIKQNLFFAFIYNFLGIPIAAGIFYESFNLKLNPMFAAFAMSMSSLCVIINSLRIKNISLNINNYNKIKEKILMQKTIIIEGMVCNHCKSNIEKIILSIDGVKNCDVDLKNKKAIITLNQNIDNQVFIDAIKNAGYEPISII